MNVAAVILDTETTDKDGIPIQIAYAGCHVLNDRIETIESAIFDQLYSSPHPISFGAMAVHHILPSDIAGKPSHKSFRLPESVEYVIGHNINFDLKMIAKCGQKIGHLKSIDTLLLARKYIPNAPSYKLGALSYYISNDLAATRERLKDAHNAMVDLLLTQDLLNYIVDLFDFSDLSFETLHQMSNEALIPTHMPFGKYAGQPIAQIPVDYFNWLVKQPNVNKYLLKAIEQYSGVTR
ncbi:DUF3820 family protein [uncultured Acinetobacter sp.]|uniref:putative quorum-sensing-regulated virulence factor n=1 Tax=uncultured Acinetobacter sp. TaxID=165433 RepID=UPI0025880789|nr:DUF3820 family protein [uncultured Acinetobacter sp.]